jgi:hypothetical protein
MLTYRANIRVDLVVDRVRKPWGKHPVKSPELRVNADVRRERSNISEKWVEEEVAELFAVLRVSSYLRISHFAVAQSIDSSAPASKHC